jgi:hypothetical protein
VGAWLRNAGRRPLKIAVIADIADIGKAKPLNANLG